MVASRSDAHGSEDAPGRHSHTGETEPPDVATVELDGRVTAVVWLPAGLVGVEPHAATSNAALTPAITARKPARPLDLRLTTATIYHGNMRKGPRQPLGVVATLLSMGVETLS